MKTTNPALQKNITENFIKFLLESLLYKYCGLEKPIAKIVDSESLNQRTRLIQSRLSSNNFFRNYSWINERKNKLWDFSVTYNAQDFYEYYGDELYNYRVAINLLANIVSLKIPYNKIALIGFGKVGQAIYQMQKHIFLNSITVINKKIYLDMYSKYKENLSTYLFEKFDLVITATNSSTPVIRLVKPFEQSNLIVIGAKYIYSSEVDFSNRNKSAIFSDNTSLLIERSSQIWNQRNLFETKKYLKRSDRFGNNFLLQDFPGTECYFLNLWRNYHE